MITIYNTEVVGWEAAIRGMRNPLESWNKSDSSYCNPLTKCYSDCEKHECEVRDHFALGPNDFGLMMRLRNAGTDHRKFMRMIVVYVDILAPLYWWKEFDTYRAGVKYLDNPNPFDIEVNSCSTMHKIAAKEFTLEDFSHEHLNVWSLNILKSTVERLNRSRNIYLYGGFTYDENDKYVQFEPKSKYIWWQMIQLLPSSYNQKRTVMLNYEVLANIYKSRKDHKLDEWRKLCDWIRELPYSELITGED